MHDLERDGRGSESSVDMRWGLADLPVRGSAAPIVEGAARPGGKRAVRE
jgi:hypothetical protein